MNGIYTQKNSPYYWIRYYDKLEPDPNRRRKSVNTKIEITKADLRRLANRSSGEKIKLEGTPELKKLAAGFKAGLAERDIKAKTNTRIKKDLIFSEGVKEYIDSKTRIGDKKSLKEKTIKAYKTAADRFIDGTGHDTLIRKYTNYTDFKKFLMYLEERELKEPTRHSYTKALSTLWNYFVEQGYCRENIIEIYEASSTPRPEDIPLNDLRIILKYYKENHPERWEFIYYLLLTMNRPSTALVQKRGQFHFNQKYVEMLNVKATRKKNPIYIFPLFKELEELTKKIMERPDSDNSDRLFSHIKIGKHNYTDGIYWWYSDQRIFKAAGIISRTYEIKQIRKTFPSYAYNELGMSEEEIQYLLDHTDKSITETFYLNKRFDKIRSRFEKNRMVGDSDLDNEFEIYKDDVKITLNAEELREKIKSIKKSPNTFDIKRKELKKLLLSEISIVQIAKKYNVSDAAVHKRIKKLGLEQFKKGNKK